jgi:hypothetical protein
MRRYVAISGLTMSFVVLAGAGPAAAVSRSPDSAEGSSGLTAMSCGSRGNCSAGGYFANPADDVSQVFVVNEKKGTWGRAAELAGLAALNVGKSAQMESMSCPSAANCSAIGFYSIGEDNRRSFVAGEKNGKWGRAEKVPGTGSLEIAGVGTIMSVSCSSTGNCAAFGTYATDSGSTPSYVVSETRGVWHKAVRLRGVTIDAISCGAAGNCVAGGYSVAHLITSSGHAITVGEVRGKWGKPRDLTGAPAKATGAPRVTAVSCRSAGNCSAGGDYATKGGVQAFVATESKGKWRNAQELPGIAALSVRGNTGLFSLSCASAGNCSAGGSYVDAKGVFQAFVADERGGTWARAQEVPGTAALNVGPVGFTAAQVNVLSCRSPGSCSAAGFYTDKKGSQQVFTDSQSRGGWAKATEVPGTGALNLGGTADLLGLSCASAANCAAGGYYTDARKHPHAFVADQRAGTWGRAQIIAGLASLSLRA